MSLFERVAVGKGGEADGGTVIEAVNEKVEGEEVRVHLHGVGGGGAEGSCHDEQCLLLHLCKAADMPDRAVHSCLSRDRSGRGQERVSCV